MTDGEYSVWRFRPDGTYYAVAQGVSVGVAMALAESLIAGVGARIGTTAQVMITDGGDFCNFLWERGVGVVYPTLAMRAEVDSERRASTTAR